MHITGGYLKSRKIDSPKGENVRPTLSQIRESIFSILYSMIEFENSDFLDLFSGSGIMGFEAVSRGFKSADFIEKDRKTFSLIKTNAEKLGLNKENADFHFGDSIKVLRKINKKFDVIYVDPPYQSGLYDSVLDSIHKSEAMKKDGIIILEHPKDLGIHTENYEVLKQKNYSGKIITFLGFSN